MEKKRVDVKEFSQLMNECNSKNAENGIDYRFTWEYVYPIVNGGANAIGINASVYKIDELVVGEYKPVDELKVAVEIDCSNYNTNELESQLDELVTALAIDVWGPESEKKYFL